MTAYSIPEHVFVYASRRLEHDESNSDGGIRDELGLLGGCLHYGAKVPLTDWRSPPEVLIESSTLRFLE